jgi:acyl-CoA thioesterase
VLRGNFLADTDLHPDGGVAARWGIEVSPAWNVFYTFGGLSMALALRGVERELDRPDLRPLSANAVFVSPVSPGHVDVDVDVLRQGRSASQATADVVQNGQRALRLTATFGASHDTPVTYTGATFPADVLRPDEAGERPEPPADNAFPKINLHEQNDWRPALPGFAWFRPGPAGPPRFASWYRLMEEPRLDSGAWDPVSLCLPGDMLGPAVFRPFGPAAVPSLVLSLEIGLHWFAPVTTTWLLQHVTVAEAGDGYATGTTELWDENEVLVGLAVQRALIKPFSG